MELHDSRTNDSEDRRGTRLLITRFVFVTPHIHPYKKSTQSSKPRHSKCHPCITFPLLTPQYKPSRINFFAFLKRPVAHPFPPKTVVYCCLKKKHFCFVHFLSSSFHYTFPPFSSPKLDQSHSLSVDTIGLLVSSTDTPVVINNFALQCLPCLLVVSRLLLSSSNSSLPLHRLDTALPWRLDAVPGARHSARVAGCGR